jgi:hypothetical protein
MAKLVWFASWNFEQFQGQRDRFDGVVGLLAEHDPHVLRIVEVKGRNVFAALMSRMPEHTFTITESNRYSGNYGIAGTGIAGTVYSIARRVAE